MIKEREFTEYIIIHHSNTSDDRDLGLEDLKDSKYHFIIRRNGLIEIGLDSDAEGEYHTESIDICLIGKSEFDERQFEGLRDLVQLTLRLHPDCKIVGHGDLDDTDCPGFDVVKWISEAIPSIHRP